MAKIEIDNKKMWESIIGFQLEGEEAKKFNDLCKYKPFKAALAFFSKAFKKGLKDQGLEYKDGKIVEIYNGIIPKFKVGDHIKKASQKDNYTGCIVREVDLQNQCYYTEAPDGKPIGGNIPFSIQDEFKYFNTEPLKIKEA